MPEVYCSVDTCKFWGKDNKCLANKIWVRNNLTASVENDFNQEYADELGIAYYKHLEARTSAQTCCETMQPK